MMWGCSVANKNSDLFSTAVTFIVFGVVAAISLGMLCGIAAATAYNVFRLFT